MKQSLWVFIGLIVLIMAGCEENIPSTSDSNTPSTNKNTAVGFSVSSSKRVIFSSGNLQYHPANNIWRFATNQTDYVGEANSNISSTYSGWVDLFSWNSSTDKDDYNCLFVDWGINKIGNYAPNTWRTLSYDEWYYLCWERENHSILCGVAQVNGVNGLILLPDKWICPSDVIFKSGFYINSSIDAYSRYQTFSKEQWSKLENRGAIFLPAAGMRAGSLVYGIQQIAGYWSSTWNQIDQLAYYFIFSAQAINMSPSGSALSVRLVKDL